MDFLTALDIINNVIPETKGISYDGVIVKKLEPSNTLDAGRTTNQTHIAITGNQMDIFPYMALPGYFDKEYEQRDEVLKKYYIIQIPIRIFKSNVERLGEKSDDIPFADDGTLLTASCVLRSRRNGAADQVQLSLIANDDANFITFRRKIHAGSYLVILKRKELFRYDAFAVKSQDAEELASLNNSFLKESTKTVVNVMEFEQEKENDLKEENEYERAANILRKFVESNDRIQITEKSDIEKTRNVFLNLFSPEKLKELSDDELLNKVFYTQGDNSESLCCWIEMNKECKKHFGSISGGSAYKFGLFQKQDNGKWVTGGPLKQQELSYAEAVGLGRRIVSALLKGASIIAETTLDTIEEYEKLDDVLRTEVSEDGIYYNWAWFHKYYSILFPDKLSSYHSEDWQKHVLWALRIKPSEKYYARSGQIAMVQKLGGWWYRQFGDVFIDRFGGIKQFLRLGSSDGSKGYASEWKKESIVGIGWPGVGSLDEYRDEDGGLDKGKLSAKLQEVYYPNDPSTSSRKAGELIRFYESNQNTVFVVADGEKLIGLVDNVGEYRYDDSSSDMSNIKTGIWKSPFGPDEKLPVKSDGLLTSCVQIKKEENIMYLYEKYYYDTESDIKDESMLEDNKKMKNCLEIEREARTDKSYPLNVIIYGAPGTGKTYGTAEYALKIIGVPVPDNRKDVMKAYNNLVRSGQIVFTTFHQSYGYEEFIQGLRPDTESDRMSFKTVDGVFKKIADKALNDLENNYVIIIDEINRANISKVFGELITLIEDDKRWGEVNETCATLQSGDVFAVPNNLYIVGTMNSADKSISLIDAALRRRFVFKEQRPNAELIKDQILRAYFIKLNAYLYDSLGSADLLVGHSYFMNKTTKDLPEIMNDSIIPLLYEYFYDNKKNVNKALEDTLGKVDYTVVDNKTGRIFIIEKE